jgi:hypothetical protein
LLLLKSLRTHTAYLFVSYRIVLGTLMITAVKYFNSLVHPVNVYLQYYSGEAAKPRRKRTRRTALASREQVN